ncbi:MAG TPA: type II toxin-antitoxin system RelE/ParE family toxin [Dehalococcoidia bacterium]|nr:type II toxin-antitoxin system RelE/ParE family toxin [Dehalococcoidia bacterium]
MYRLEVSHTAHRQVCKLPVKTQERVNRAIARLADEPRPVGTKKLTGREGYRVRVGDYRILYHVDDASKVVVIYRVMSRGDVYRLR